MEHENQKKYKCQPNLNLQGAKDNQNGNEIFSRQY